MKKNTSQVRFSFWAMIRNTLLMIPLILIIKVFDGRNFSGESSASGDADIIFDHSSTEGDDGKEDSDYVKDRIPSGNLKIKPIKNDEEKNFKKKVEALIASKKKEEDFKNSLRELVLTNDNDADYKYENYTIAKEIYLEDKMAEERLKSSLKNRITKSIDLVCSHSMTLGTEYEVICRVNNMDNSISVTQKQQESAVPVITDTLRTSNNVSMVMNGDYFEIELLSERQQILNQENKFTEWKWKVLPTDNGEHTLQIEVYALLPTLSSQIPYRVKTITKPIEVNVGFFNGILLFLRNNYEWFLATWPFIYWIYLNKKHVEYLEKFKNFIKQP